jgi:hypothetical protein
MRKESCSLPLPVAGERTDERGLPQPVGVFKQHFDVESVIGGFDTCSAPAVRLLTRSARLGQSLSADRGGPADRVKDRERIEVIAPVSDLAVDDR